MEYFEIAVTIINYVGVLVVLYGVVKATIRFFYAEILQLQGKDGASLQSRIRVGLGKYLLLGLELIIAADIIETIISPSLDELLILAIIVAIRTVLSFFLSREIKEVKEDLED